MASDYQDHLSSLFRSLGLPASDIGSPEGTTIEIGDIEVTIAEDPYGRRLVVSAIAGRLAEDAATRRRQVADILRKHLGAILDFSATVSLDPADPARIVVAGSQPYGIGTELRLRRLIEDVATLASRYQDIVTPRAAAGAWIGDDFGQSLIFRP